MGGPFGVIAELGSPGRLPSTMYAEPSALPRTVQLTLQLLLG